MLGYRPRMHRLAAAAAALGLSGLAACGTEDDNRPRTLEYVTASILQPSCGNAQCHSSFRRVDDYAFDTVEEARDSILTYQLVIPTAPDDSLLYKVLVSPGGDQNVKRMPYDQPISDRDVELIFHWIQDGADGL
jgi:hypothetical protein